MLKILVYIEYTPVFRPVAPCHHRLERLILRFLSQNCRTRYFITKVGQVGGNLHKNLKPFGIGINAACTCFNQMIGMSDGRNGEYAALLSFSAIIFAPP